VVAILEYFSPSEPPSAAVSNPVFVVLVPTVDPQFIPQSNQTSLQLTLIDETPVAPKPSPTEFIVSYWHNVSAGRLETSWSQLSPVFRKTMHHDDYSDYVLSLQGMRVCQILASNPLVAAQDDYSATVTVHLAFQTGTQCTTNEYDFESRLIYDGVSNSWLLDQNMIK